MALGMDVSKHRGTIQNGWFIVENPIKMDDLGVPLFLETPESTTLCKLRHSKSSGACCQWQVAVKGHSAYAEAPLLDLIQNLWIEYDRITKRN